MANTSSSSGTYRKGPDNAVNNLTEKIRFTAYELYESRGKEDGHDLDDWLRAERQVLLMPVRHPL